MRELDLVREGGARRRKRERERIVVWICGGVSAHSSLLACPKHTHHMATRTFVIFNFKHSKFQNITTFACCKLQNINDYSWTPYSLVPSLHLIFIVILAFKKFVYIQFFNKILNFSFNFIESESKNILVKFNS